MSESESFRDAVAARVVVRPQQSLLVPMSLEALRVFEKVDGWADLGRSAAPFAQRPEREPGTYLHWSMPEALRCFREERVGDVVVTRYGILPDRAVVARLAHSPTGKDIQVRWWFVDAIAGTTSDTYPWDGNLQGPERLTNHGLVTLNDPTVPRLVDGRVSTLEATFVDGEHDHLFLPVHDRCERRLTFYDPLDDVDEKVHPTVSYLVAAWYGDPKDDVVHQSGGGCALRRLIEALGWALTADPGDVAEDTDANGALPLAALFASMRVPATTVTEPSLIYDWRLVAHGAVCDVPIAKQPQPQRTAERCVLATHVDSAAFTAVEPGISLERSRLLRAWAGDALTNMSTADATLHKNEFIESAAGTYTLLTKTADRDGTRRAENDPPRAIEVPHESWWQPREPTLVLSGCERSYRFGQDGRFRPDGRVLVRIPESVVSHHFIYANAPPSKRIYTVAAAALLAPTVPDVGLAKAPVGIAALVAELALLAQGSNPTLREKIPDSIEKLALITPAKLQFEQVIRRLANKSFDAFGKTYTISPVTLAIRPTQDGEMPSPVALATWRQPWVPIVVDWKGDVVRSDVATWQLGEVDFAPPAPWDLTNPGVLIPVQQRMVLTVGSMDQLRDRLDHGAARRLTTPIGAHDELSRADALFVTLAGVRASLHLPAATAELGAGAFRLNDSEVVDAFGQRLDAGDAPRTIAPDDAVAGAPDWFALPPRFGTRGRAVLTLLDPDGTGTPEGSPKAAGFLMPDHVDDAIEAYTTEGDSIGQLRVVPIGNDAEVVWEVAPGRDAPLGAEPRAQNPVLESVLRGIARSPSAGETGVTAWLRAVDTTLWSIDPLGPGTKEHMTLLVGRPLAVYRARVVVELDGATSGTTIDVRLGSAAMADDGLVGFYVGDDYSKLHVVHPDIKTNALPSLRGKGFLGANPSAARLGFVSHNPTVEPITNPLIADGQSLTVTVGKPVELTLLIDPRGSIAVTAGVFPRASLPLRRESIEASLARFRLSFRIGPVLADPEGVRMPLMKEIQGKWAWMRRPDPATWREEPVEQPSKAPRLGPRPHRVDFGWLTVTNADPSAAANGAAKP